MATSWSVSCLDVAIKLISDTIDKEKICFHFSLRSEKEFDPPRQGQETRRLPGSRDEAMAQLTVGNVSNSFGGAVRAVDRLTFEVADREFVFLLGPSGAGKTTTLRMIAGLETPDEGRILFDGRDMTFAAPRDRNVAMIYDKNSLYPHLTAYENMAYPLRLRRMTEAEIDERVKRVAETLRISHLIDRAPRQLSGGQQQRVAIGRMLVRDAGLFLMDEPISHLDAKLRSHMRLEFKKLQREFDATILYVSHDQLEAMTMGDRIVVLDKGRVQQIGAPRDIFERPANRFVAEFVGEPTMNFLSCEIRASGDRTFVDGGDFQLPLPANFTCRSPEICLGLRPQHLTLVDPAATTPAIRGEIYAIETLGSATIFDIAARGRILRVQTKPNAARQRALRIGDPVAVAADPARLHVFDAATGEARLHAAEGRRAELAEATHRNRRIVPREQGQGREECPPN
jgi:ABC-type sugar transport system ATPase subunit